MRADKRKRGLSLIEVMTSLAVASLLMVAATAIFTVIIRQRREAERLIDVESSGVITLAQLKTELGNAGYRWPAPLFAVRVFNDPPTLDSGGNLMQQITTSTGCGAGGRRPGTDVVELVIGHAGFVPGDTQGITAGAAPGTDYRVVLTQFGSGPTAAVPPFLMSENATGNGVVLFAMDNGESCIGRVTGGPSGSTNINVTMLDRNYNDVMDKTTTYPNCLVGSTPKARVYRLGSRIRYMICNDDVAGTRSSLYRQQADAEPAGFGYGTPPVMVQPGVEDLQISSRLYARGSPLTGTGNDCAPAPTPGSEAFCFCNESTSSACDIMADPAPNVLTRNSWGAWLSGLRISVSATGARPMADVPQAAAIALKDHVPSPTPDGRRRIQMDLGMGFTNLVQVVP